MKNKNKQQHGLQVPPSYFDTLEDEIFIKIAEDKLPKETGFKVPETYFKSMENQVISKVASKNEPKVILLFSKKYLSYAVSIAAVLVIALFVIVTKKPLDIDTLQTSEIEAYVSSGQLDLNTLDIAQLMTEEDIETLQIEAVTFSEENLENYLLESINDTSLLIE